MGSLELSKNEGVALIMADPVPYGDPLLPILERGGIVRVKLDEDTARQLRDSQDTLKDFFSRPLDEKMHFSVAGLIDGYRPERTALTNGFRDRNDSFIRQDGPFPKDDDPSIHTFLDAIDFYTGLTDPLITQVLTELAEKHRGKVIGHTVSSFTQVNSYRNLDQYEQQRTHEDATILTVHTSFGAPGLEAVNPAVVRLPSHASRLKDVDVLGYAPEDYVPVPSEYDELTVMAAGIMTALTGGQVRPLYHRSVASEQLRSLGVTHRLAEMRFVNPNANQGEVDPFVSNAFNDGFSILQQTLNNPTDYFYLATDSVRT